MIDLGHPWRTANEKAPCIAVLKQLSPTILLTTLIAGTGASYITGLYLFLPAFFNSILQFVLTHFLLVLTVSIFLCSLSTLVFGYLSQKYSKPLLMLVLTLIGTLCAPLIFLAYVHHIAVVAFIVFSCLLIGAIWGVIPGGPPSPETKHPYTLCCP